MNMKKLLVFLGFMAISLILIVFIFYIFIENYTEKQTQINNTQLISLNEPIITNDKHNEFFTYGETKQFSIFTGENFTEKCLNSQPENIQNKVRHIVKITSNNLFGRKYTLEQITSKTYQLIKIFPENLKISHIKCSQIIYNKESKEFMYNNKPLRFLLNSSYNYIYY